jgi:phage FluMu protein Com
VIQEYRCQRCRHLLFKGSLKLLLTKQHDPDKDYIEPKCPKCGAINRFQPNLSAQVEKTD